VTKYDEAMAELRARWAKQIERDLLYGDDDIETHCTCDEPLPGRAGGRECATCFRLIEDLA
jgi:hypothetical protein